MSRGSASAATMEAEPPDMRYQAEPGNEYNHLGLLYTYFKCTLFTCNLLYLDRCRQQFLPLLIWQYAGEIDGDFDLNVSNPQIRDQEILNRLIMPPGG